MLSNSPHQIYLLRHAQVEQLSPRRFIGCANIPLDTTGKEQAHQMGKALSHIPFDKVVCSDLDRAVQTANIIVREHSARYDIQQLALLREINLGRWEGLTLEEVEKKFPGQQARQKTNAASFHPLQGESMSQVTQRAKRFLMAMEHHPAQTVLAISHAQFIKALLELVHKESPETAPHGEQEYCHLSLLTYNTPHWRLSFSNQDAAAFATRS